jgi:hypothetical protein
MAGEEDVKIAAEESRRKKRNRKGTQKGREDKRCDETMGRPPRFSLVGRPFTTMTF